MKTTSIKTTAVCFLLIAAGLLLTGFAYGKEDYSKFPTHPITFVCPLPPGSTADLTARLIGKAAEKYLGQPVVVVNKPGAGNVIGTAAIAAAKPDGYTVGYTAPTAMLVAPFVEQVPYHPLKDIQQIIQYSESPFGIVVKSDSPFKTFKDLVAFARNNPNKLTYGTTGKFSIVHLTMLQVAKKEGLQFSHMPFKGGPEQQAALLGGHIDFGVGDYLPSLIDAGQLRLLALLGEKKTDYYPGVPVFKELGYGRPDVPPAPIYMNVGGPKGIPEEIVKKLEQAFTQATKEPSYTKGMKDLRFPDTYKNSKEMTDYITYYYGFYGNLLKDMGLRKY